MPADNQKLPGANHPLRVRACHHCIIVLSPLQEFIYGLWWQNAVLSTNLPRDSQGTLWLYVCVRVCIFVFICECA